MYRIDEEIVPPITLFEWLVTLVISVIPGFNVIMLLFWSFAKGVNPNKANFAKAALIFLLFAYASWYLFFKPLFSK